MGRRLLASILALCVPVGGLCAPLVHAHADDHRDPHHQGARVHAHLGGHGGAHHHVHDVFGRDASRDHSHDVTHAARVDHAYRSWTGDVEESSERSISVQYFVAVDTHAFVPTALQQDGYRLPAPLELVLRRAPTVVHSHGPPSRAGTAPRAPPLPLA